MNDFLAGGFRIGEHTIQPARGRIVSPAGEAHIEPRAMDVLLVLARRPGDTISRDELIEAVWKHPHVSDEALSRCISILRHALGDDRSQPRFLETIPKRGYRLVAPVQVAGLGNAANEALPEHGVRAALDPDREAKASAPFNAANASLHGLQPRSSVAELPDWSKTNLALQPTRIIGRESELADVRSLLASQRLITLTGSAGVGKTRLAIEVGIRSAADFADGVWLVELAPLSDATLIPAMVSTLLGIELGHSQSPTKELARRIGARNVLLILDNCEHLIDAAAALAETILGAAPNVRLLATSQILVGIAGEQVYRVPSLAVPSDDRLAPDEVMSAAAVQLFVERAKAADAHFHLQDESAAAIAAICRRLDGIPLAIEMAAARAPLFGIEQLAHLLDERFRVLTGGRRTAMPRQQTLRATLDWSVGLLSERERIVFDRLAVFAGGFTFEAASAVASDDVIDELEVVHLVTNLIARSLVVADTNAASKRYRLLETTRAYALERFDQSDDADRVRTRHLAFYLAFAEKARPELFRPEQGAWMTRLDLERENMLSAHAWCDRTEKGAALGLRLAYALKPYWFRCGLLGLGHRVATEALARTKTADRNLARCRVLLDAGQLCSFMDRHTEAQSYLKESLAIAREIGDKERASAALRLLGIALCELGDSAAARQHFEMALALARELDDTFRLGDALNAIAEFHRREGDLDAAEPCYQESLALARGHGDLDGISIALADLAMVSVGRRSGEGAPELLLEALAIVERSGSKWAGQLVLAVSAGLAAFFGEWKRAAQLYGAAKAQNESMGVHQDPADDTFLLPLLARTREVLGTVAFAAAETTGRAIPYDQSLAEVRTWLQTAAARRKGPSAAPEPGSS